MPAPPFSRLGAEGAGTGVSAFRAIAVSRRGAREGPHRARLRADCNCGGWRTTGSRFPSNSLLPLCIIFPLPEKIQEILKNNTNKRQNNNQRDEEEKRMKK